LSSIKVGIIGNGSWATALAKIIGEHENTEILWHFRKEADVEYFNTYQSNPRYLRDVKFYGKEHKKLPMMRRNVLINRIMYC